MLAFFRKHQRAFFTFVAVIIIISFAGFGTFSLVNDSSVAKKEEFLFKTLGGESVSKQAIERMVYFLSSSQRDLKEQQDPTINLLNDGVLEQDFLDTALGQALAEKIFPLMQEDVKQAVEKIRSFRSYRHPFQPMMSAESLWAQFSPESLQIISQLSSCLTPQAFASLAKLYQQQKALPSFFLKRMLSYQEGQAAGGQTDPGLAAADLSLTGLHRPKDFFGQSYLEAAAQVIFNAASLAKKMGYSVSKEEVRNQLLVSLQGAIQMVAPEEASKIPLYQAFLSQVRRLGMTEQECLDLWQHVVLFRRVFQDPAASMFIEPSLLEEFYQFAGAGVSIEQYSLPSHLKIHDFYSLLKLDVYREAVAPDSGFFSRPTTLFPLEEIEKKAPDLVQRDYTLETSEVDVKSLSLDVSVRQMWDWQGQDLGWAALQKQFAFLAKEEAITKQERLQVLEKLEESKALEVDRFSRKHIVQSDLHYIKDSLMKAPKQTRRLSLSTKGAGLPFKNIKQGKVLMGWIEGASFQQEAKDKLSFYTEDGEHYYQIAVLERAEEKRVLSFVEANQLGILRKIVDRRLEEVYPEVRKKDSLTYMQKDGSWKPLSEVKEKVGMVAFAPFLKTIASQYQETYGVSPSLEQRQTGEFYVNYWALGFLKSSLQQMPSTLIAQEGEDASLDRQWYLVKTKKTVLRSQKDYFPEEASFDLPEGSWSRFIFGDGGQAYFFRTLEKQAAKPPSFQEQKEALAPLWQEMQAQMARHFLEEIDTKKAWKL